MKWFRGLLELLVLLVIAMPLYAQNQLGGLLRDEYALGLTPTIKSAGMGGAYVGVDGIASMNPAALSSVNYYDAALTYGFYDSEWGPPANRGRLDVLFPDPFLGGTNRIILDGMESDGYGNSKAPFEYDEVTLGMQYGRNITDWWAVGMGGYPYEKANVYMKTKDGTVHGTALSELGSTQISTLFRPHEKVRIGAQFIYIKDDLEAVLPGPGPKHMGDYYYIHYFAVGISATPFEGTLLALDYWNGEIEGDINRSAGLILHQDVDRWNFGIQQKVCKYCDLRLGSNNGGLTTGFSIHINENIDVDYAYNNKALGDKESVFGETQYHGLSVNYKF